MKKAIYVISFALVLTIFICPLFSRIESRIKGEVIDRDTGKPIVGASVTLFFRIQMDDNFNREEIKTTVTDAKGNFSFEAPWSGFYFVKCKKESYVPFLPKYYYKYTKDDLLPKKAGVFHVGEGEIKHVRIELEKGGILKGVFKKKEIDKISPIKFSAWIYKESPIDESFISDDIYNIEYIYSNENGYFEIDTLESADDYYLYINLGDGYPRKRIRNIRVSKGNVTDISTTFDLSSPTGVKGNIVVNGIPPRSGYVEIESTFRDESGRLVSARYQLDENVGSYFFRSLLSGSYRIDVYCISKEGKKFRKKFDVYLSEGILLQFDISDN